MFGILDTRELVREVSSLNNFFSMSTQDWSLLDVSEEDIWAFNEKAKLGENDGDADVEETSEMPSRMSREALVFVSLDDHRP